MGTVEKFEDLEIWKLSRGLVKHVYELSRKKDFSKDYGLKDQIRRSSVSVMNNISEGFESRTTRRFIDYLGRSKGSCGETRSILFVALDCNYITQSEFTNVYDRCTMISKKIRSLMSYLEGYNSNNRVKEVLVDYDA